MNYLPSPELGRIQRHIPRLLRVGFAFIGLFALTTSLPCVNATPPLEAHSKPHRSEAELREWARHELMHEFDAWAAVQRLYAPERIEQLRAELTQRLQSLSGAELEDFIDEADQKLRILNSAAAREARQWLKDTLAVASKKRADRLRAELPDVSSMSAAELSEALSGFEAQRAKVRQKSDTFARERDEHVAAAIAQRQQEIQWNEQAASGEAASSHQPITPDSNRPFGGNVISRYGRSHVNIYWGGYRW